MNGDLSQNQFISQWRASVLERLKLRMTRPSHPVISWIILFPHFPCHPLASKPFVSISSFKTWLKHCLF